MLEGKYRISLTFISFVNLICSDFYPNSGRPSQPGCRGIASELKGKAHFRKQKKSNFHFIFLFISEIRTHSIEACSHGRSHQFFAESVLSNGFTSYKCRSYEEYDAGRCEEKDGIPMGDSAPNTARGVYYLKTSDKSPYSKGWQNAITSQFAFYQTSIYIKDLFFEIRLQAQNSHKWIEYNHLFSLFIYTILLILIGFNFLASEVKGIHLTDIISIINIILRCNLCLFLFLYWHK